MEELTSNERSFPWLRVFFIGYGICILLSLAGVVLGAINFVAGPVHYSGIVLVLWFLMDIVVLIGIVLHLVFFGMGIVSHDTTSGDGLIVPYVLFVGGGGAWASIALLVGKHFGWFSACALAVLVVCGVVDVVMMQRGKL